MPLSDKKKAELQDLAESYVGAFVKCNGPNSKFTVSGDTCDSVEDAVAIAMDRCHRPAVKIADMEEQNQVLREKIQDAILRLDCK